MLDLRIRFTLFKPGFFEGMVWGGESIKGDLSGLQLAQVLGSQGVRVMKGSRCGDRSGKKILWLSILCRFLRC